MNGYLSKFTFNLCLTAAIVSPAYGSEAEQPQGDPSEIPVMDFGPNTSSDEESYPLYSDDIQTVDLRPGTPSDEESFLLDSPKILSEEKHENTQPMLVVKEESISDSSNERTETEQSQRDPSETPVEEALPIVEQTGENQDVAEGVEVQGTNLKVVEETKEKVEDSSQVPVKIVDPFLAPLNSFFQSKVVRLPQKEWKDALPEFIKNKTWEGLDDTNANCSLISNMSGKIKGGKAGTIYQYNFGTDAIKANLETFLKAKSFKVDAVEIGDNVKGYKTHQLSKSNTLGEINVNNLFYEITIQDLMEMNAIQLIWNSNYYEFEKQSGSSEKSLKYLLKTHFGNMNVQLDVKTTKD